MQVDLQKAISEALGNLDNVSDDIVRKRIMPDKGAAEYGDPDDLQGDVEGKPAGLEVAKVKLMGGPEAEEAISEENEIPSDLLEKLKAMLESQ
jgi:hypothetical protein